MQEMKETTKRIIENAGVDWESGIIINPDTELFPVESMTKEMKKEILASGEHISKAEIRSLVNLYYQIQDTRKIVTEQIRSIEAEKANGNATILKWFLKNQAAMERSIKNIMQAVCESTEVGRWLLSIRGIGPVLGAGLMAYFDIEGKQYATQFLSYAGLNDNNRPWLGTEKTTKIVNEVLDGKKVITDEDVALIAAKTQWSYEHIKNWDGAYNPDTGIWSKTKIIAACSIIPYNKQLKVLCYKVGASFHWLCNDEDSLYGRLVSERRVKELANNEAGRYADQAASILTSKNIGKDTAAYKALSNGKLPLAHINARADRWATKIFISHLFEEMYRVHNNAVPPRYYSLAHSNGEHNKEIEPEVEYFSVS